jgi:hypothetical protein
MELAIFNNVSPRRSPAWSRFSVRSLAVVVTLLCVWLAVVANRAHRQRTIAESLRAKGAAVYYDYQVDINGHPLDRRPPHSPVALHELLGDDFLFDVVGVDFQNAVRDPNDDDMAALGGLSALRFAQTTRIAPDDRWLIPSYFPSGTLGPHDYLPGASSSKVTDLGLARLRPLCRSLEVLVIGGPNLTDKELRQIKEFTKLRRLVIVNGVISEASIEELEQSLPDCEVIAWLGLQSVTIPMMPQRVEEDPHRGRYWNTTTFLEPPW